MLVSVSNSQSVNRVFQKISVEKYLWKNIHAKEHVQKTCSKEVHKYFYVQKKIFLLIRKDLFFFVSQRKNAIINRFVKYGGLEQNFNFDHQNGVWHFHICND